jgi:UDP-N-acetylenolpyruvoylglucosamine reductase
MSQWRIDRQEYLEHNKTIFEVVNIADEDGNIINTFGAASNVIIAAGGLAGYTGVHKYGAVFGTALSTFSTVWTAADTSATALYNWGHGAGTLSVVSTSGSDVTDVTIQGLDANYEFVEETFTLTGTTPVTGSTSFTKVNRAFMQTETNVGKIQASIGGVVVTEIGADFGQTLQCFYTIPAGKTGYMTNINASASKNQSTDLFLYQRPFGGAFRVVSTISLNQSNQSIDFPVPLKFTEKTDIDLRVQGSSNATISVDFTIILVDNA